jgi:hypothetical protein
MARRFIFTRKFFFLFSPRSQTIGSAGADPVGGAAYLENRRGHNVPVREEAPHVETAVKSGSWWVHDPAGGARAGWKGRPP